MLPNEYEIIDESTWPRAMHCSIFRNIVEQAFCVTADVDITDFLAYVKSHGYSFTLAMVYQVCHSANQIPQLRYRFVDGRVALFHRSPEESLFHYQCRLIIPL